MNKSLFISLAMVVAATASANQAVTLLDTGVTTRLNGPWTLGFAFTPHSSIAVTSLGAFAPDPSYTRDIGIWDMSGNLLMTASVTGAEPVVDYFNFTSAITTYTAGGVNLAGGTEYVIGATALSGDGVWSYTPTFTVDPDLTYNGFDFASGLSLQFPTVVDTRAVSYFGGNFTFNSTTPSPAAVIPFVAGLAAAARRRRK